MIASNNIIVMNRGDSFEFKLSPQTLGNYAEYVLTGDDTLYFGLMDPGQYFEDALVRKEFDSLDCTTLNDLVIKLEPDDTLDLLPGKYFYAVKLHLDHPELNSLTQRPTGQYIDQVITLVTKTKFIIND
jgi:hypothetical protein